MTLPDIDHEPTTEELVSRWPALHLYPYQRQLILAPARFTWSCWARQTGKSFTLSLRRLVRGVTRRRTQLFLSAGMRQCQELMVKVRQHCDALRIAAADGGRAGLPARTRGEQIELPNGVRMVALPARPETIRGFTGDVMLDEFAMHADDRAIWAAIFPTILRGGGELDVASTPKGQDNLFAELRDNDLFHRVTLPLPQAVAQGLPVDLDAMRKAMGDDELFRQEFLCEFLDENTVFLPYHLIAACEDDEIETDPDWPRLADTRADLYAGVDVARKRDLTVVWLWTRRDGAGRNGWTLRYAGRVELANAPFGRQQQLLQRVLELRCVRRCCIDATGMGWPLAEWAQERFGRTRVEAVQFTAGLKAQMAGLLRRLAEEGRLRIPADEMIRHDWHSVRRSTGAGGGLRLDAARSEAGHADRFWAAALGIHAADTAAAGPAEYTPGSPLRFARGGTW